MLKWSKHITIASLLVGTFSVLTMGCKSEAEVQIQETPLEIVNPATGYSGMSRMFAAADGLYMSWIEQIDSLSLLKYAVYTDSTWSTAQTIASGTDWFVNWADFPTIAVNNGNIFAHYLQKSAPDTYTYDIKYKLYNKASQQWSEPRKLHTDTTKSEHGFVSVIPYSDGGFMASWLDGRTTVNVADSLRQMTLRAGIINSDASLGKQWELDNRVCDCCATSIANTSKGPKVVYRDRSPDEIRDVYSVQLQDSLWSEPQAVHNDNWNINGCPVNGPAIASTTAITAAAWFTNADDKPLVKISITNSEQNTTAANIIVASKSPMGRVNVAIDNLENTYVVWMSNQGRKAAIQLKAYNKEGQLFKTMTLAQTAMQRSSGFPQLTIFNEYLYLSYTQADQDQSLVKTLKLPLTALQKIN